MQTKNNTISIQQLNAMKKEAKAKLAQKFKHVKPIYSIYDQDAGFQDVFMQTNDAIAVRAFSEAVNNEQSPFYRYPDKFNLCRVGELDIETGEIEPCMVHIMSAKNCKEDKRNEKNINKLK